MTKIRLEAWPRPAQRQRQDDSEASEPAGRALKLGTSMVETDIRIHVYTCVYIIYLCLCVHTYIHICTAYVYLNNMHICVYVCMHFLFEGIRMRYMNVHVHGLC